MFLYKHIYFQIYIIYNRNLYIYIDIMNKMSWFTHKKSEENVDLTLKDELKSLKARITRIESEVLDIMTAQEIIRNKVLRKIQAKKPEAEEEDTETWAGIPKTTTFK